MMKSLYGIPPVYLLQCIALLDASTFDHMTKRLFDVPTFCQHG
jgi:hypothetical protein